MRAIRIIRFANKAVHEKSKYESLRGGVRRFAEPGVRAAYAARTLAKRGDVEEDEAVYFVRKGMEKAPEVAMNLAKKAVKAYNTDNGAKKKTPKKDSSKTGK